VLGRGIDNNVRKIILRMPDNVKKVQRREYVRIQSVEYINYVILDKVKINEDLIRKELPLKAVMKDFSGGGVRIRVKEELKIGDMLLLSIPSGEDKNLLIYGEVVRIEQEQNENLCGIKFNDIDEKSREKLIKLGFGIMRKRASRE
jgi:c-di-GMP-binding flagellar brake protein YcgR